jgi:glutamine cyclotransferase
VRHRILLIAAMSATALVGGMQAQTRPKAAAAPAAGASEYGYKVVNRYPHDRTAFTQGLEYHDGFLYEGTGLNGRSTLRKVKLETGEVLQQVRLGGAFFGEGITVLPHEIVQLTWQSGMGFVYDRDTLRMSRSFNYPGEGWGLTNDGKRIFMSDGTAQIRRWDPATLQEQQRITVRDGSKEIASLNELEWIKGEIYANVWQTDRIARISPEDGRVLAWINLAGLAVAHCVRDPAGAETLAPAVSSTYLTFSITPP